MRRTPLTSAGSTRPGRPFVFPSIDLVLELRHLPPQIQMSWRQHPVFFPAPVYQENLYQENPALEQAANLNGVHQQVNAPGDMQYPTTPTLEPVEPHWLRTSAIPALDLSGPACETPRPASASAQNTRGNTRVRRRSVQARRANIRASLLLHSFRSTGTRR
ncbi:hypothetical protein SISNIDRAFT_247 [Sistotremastrum niveocremeum HHB9708]|uniref:Uncharacterized protein n=1 Tax=Sistotremastrum niveocremeum HHB9708 TaxID=1314777 RepID=A0A165ABA2_9AGAM|nr:hypothetical protein SISNIDRAFT_247 [Sistotremastrum niveocremeum HHB9708]